MPKPIRFPSDVPGWLSEAEGQTLAELAEGRVVLEFGSYLGRSTICLAQAAERVHAVDWFRGDDGSEWNFPGFVENLERHGVRQKVVAHVGHPSQLLGAFRPGSFDVILHDALHDFDSVRRDIVSLAGLADPRRSWFLFHDYANPDFPGVRRAADLAFPGRPPKVVDSLAIFANGCTAGDPSGPLLSVVTACSRPANLPAIHRNLVASFRFFCVRWLVFFDRSAVVSVPPLPWYHAEICDGPSIGGTACKNRGVEAIPSGLVYFLDDDNLFHPDFELALAEAVRENPAAKGFVFNQLRSDGSRRLEAGYDKEQAGNNFPILLRV
jgi:Methyltransferase domain